MLEVFISHSSTDDAFVSRLAADMRRAGLESWIDHEDIQGGEDWDHAVEKAINRCGILVFVVTKDSLESEVCRDEWNLAVEKNKLVIPILRAGHLGYDDLPLRLKRKQTVDFRGNYDLAFKHLITALGVEKKTAPLPPIPYDDGEDPTVVATKLPALDWIEIPAGEVIIDGAGGSQTAHWVEGFSITKYPISVMQYDYFVQYECYKNANFWTQDGWAWRIRNVITLPQYWRNTRWHALNRPIVGVSWHEAFAFSQWLSSQFSKDGRLVASLPTEQQWQRAAQGDDGRLYPWGNEYDPSRCNTDESGIGKTTPIDQYPSGVSPYGVYDLCGNVWEWCLNQWNSREPGSTSLDKTDKRAMRGGSWRLDHKTANCVSRAFSQPEDRFSFIGFRLVLTSPPPET